MTKKPCWGRNILGRLSKQFSLVLLVVCVMPLVARAETLAELTRNYRDKKTTTNKKALLAYATEHAGDYTGALARFALGATLAESETGWKEGLEHLKAAAPGLVRLKDYIGYYTAVAQYEAREDAAAIRALDPTINSEPVSPLRPEAVMLAASIYYEAGQVDQTVSLIRDYSDELPQPQSLLLLADAQMVMGENAAAAANYQRVYYEYPTSEEASTAATQAGKLRRKLGKNYPPATAEMMFTRVDRLIKAKQHETARKELQSLTTRLAGADRDRARVWLGKARHLRRHDAVAYRWLSKLRVKDPSADAERYYWLMESSRRLGRHATMANVRKRMAEKHPDSGWRLRALRSAGNMYLLANDHANYIPIFTEAVAFAPDSDAVYCHWKVAWSHYIRRLPSALGLFREHLTKFPDSVNAPVALYFLGRLGEKDASQAVAKAWYEEVANEYPNHYYAVLARERLRTEAVAAAKASDEVIEFLAGIDFPDRVGQISFEATAANKRRMSRERLLTMAGLYEMAEKELYFAAKREGGGAVLAMDLARSAVRREDYDQSIRYIKALAPDYLSVPVDIAPAAFWRLAFPLRYSEEMEKYGSRRGIELHLLAAVIRQESEFNPRAVSAAKAYGLTQVLPATGRSLARKLGYKSFRTSMLYDPAVNMNMGTYHFREMIDSLEGRTEAALAAYNAGKSRVARWLTWGEFREPAEFIETIPFSETRGYVKKVLRNADLYRRIYRTESE
ncbi:MAG: transglycosylase SLT domain-containing protein [bacterium]|nr:transglycosylase SLT domain-containing protein [bacterium]